MKRELTDKVRVSHVLDAIGEVEKYLDGVSYDDFLSNSEKKFATIKQVEIIGEACNRISKVFKDRHPEIKWKEINGFRNISIHEYFGIDYRIVWEIAQMIWRRLRDSSKRPGRKIMSQEHKSNYGVRKIEQAGRLDDDQSTTGCRP